MSKQAGIVLESGRGWAIIMRPDGAYQKIKTNQPLYPGQYYYQRQLPALPYGVAAAVLLFILVGAIDFFNVVAYASISSGIELGVNRWDRVVTVKTESEAAAQVVSQVDINGRPAQEAVAAVVSEIIAKDSMPENGTGTLQVSVHSKKAGQELEAEYKRNLVAKINLSVNQALKVHDKVKVKGETVEEKLQIEYKPATKKDQDLDQAKKTPPGNAWGHDINKNKTANYKDNKDAVAIPVFQRYLELDNSVNRGNRDQKTDKDKTNEKSDRDSEKKQNNENYKRNTDNDRDNKKSYRETDKDRANDKNYPATDKNRNSEKYDRESDKYRSTEKYNREKTKNENSFTKKWLESKTKLRNWSDYRSLINPGPENRDK